LQVPLAIVSDLVLPRAWLVDPQAPRVTSLAAAAAVVAGFIAINCAAKAEDRRTERAEHEGDCDMCLCQWTGTRVPLLGRRADDGTLRLAPNAPASDAPDMAPDACAPSVINYGTIRRDSST